MRTLKLSPAAFDALPDFSGNLPELSVVPRKWKSRKDYYDASKGWLRGEYTPTLFPGKNPIEWLSIVVKAVPMIRLAFTGHPSLREGYSAGKWRDNTVSNMRKMLRLRERWRKKGFIRAGQRFPVKCWVEFKPGEVKAW